MSPHLADMRATLTTERPRTSLRTLAELCGSALRYHAQHVRDRSDAAHRREPLLFTLRRWAMACDDARHDGRTLPAYPAWARIERQPFELLGLMSERGLREPGALVALAAEFDRWAEEVGA